MRSWIFAHNQHDGLPADVAQVLLKIKADNPTLTIDHWPPSRLLDLTRDLPEERLITVFGHPPRERDMRTLDRNDIAEAVAGLALQGASWTPNAIDLPVVDPRKLDYNKLSEHPRRLITAGITQAGLVEGYFDNNPDPTLRDRAGMRMKLEWFTLQQQGIAGDEAFQHLFDHVASHAKGSRELTASLALLAFLFESCDIFANPPADWLGAAT
jgi:hypothetical protein